MLNKKNWLEGTAALLLVFGIMLSACAPEIDGAFGAGLLGGGSGFIPKGDSGDFLSSEDDGKTIEQKIKDLPEFTGSAVSSEVEAREMATSAMTQIDLAAMSALGHPAQSYAPNRAVVASGNYSYGGVTLTYSISTTGDYPNPPCTATIKELLTINGTYGGYTISGKGMKINCTSTYTSSTSYSMKYNYDCAFTVSYNGKGMKLIQTGAMDLVYTGTSYSYTYKLHYTIYDNDNKVIHNFDYNIPL